MGYEGLKLDHQLCFPLYAAAKEVVGRYKPFLDALNLTYTQYITMMVMWEAGTVTVGELGARVHLDSGTLTPLLKRLESKGYIRRERSRLDERTVVLTITEDGEALKEQAVYIPQQLAQCLPLSQEESGILYELLYKLLGSSTKQS
ncbi:MAG: MarR family winged helix-turn-helix transcriptional regulator [Lachnospiraceae bacterium]